MDIKENSLYRQIIMEHYKNPQNAYLVEDLKKYSIKNPTCGDSVIVQVDIQDGVIKNIYQKSIGCSISTSSTSIMSELLKNKSTKEAKNIIINYVKMVKGDAYDKSVDLGEAIAYSGIADYPARFKCATVSFEGVLKAIEDYEIKNKK
ncbi:MAG: SUF system NifU family Fe-S cluster assembly protein [Clostridia bacterium]|nr:SUF system NifU family Fe-S cluster assembly protein [Clostridia bacterium]